MKKFRIIKDFPKDVYLFTKQGQDTCTEFVAECATPKFAKLICKALNQQLENST